jgi:hypothetical protein
MFKYNLDKDKETKIKGFHYYEKDYYLLATMNRNFGEKLIHYCEDSSYTHSVCDNLEIAKTLCTKLSNENYMASILVNASTMEVEA